MRTNSSWMLSFSVALWVTEPAVGASSWANRYGGIDADSATSVLEQSPGTILAVLSTASFSPGPLVYGEPLVLWLDASGNVSRAAKYSDGFGSVGVDGALLKADGGILLYGRTQAPSMPTGGVEDGLLVSLDAVGSVQWARGYQPVPTRSTYAYAVAQSPDGNYLALLFSSSAPSLSRLAKINASDGSIAWALDYRSGTDRDLVSTTDGGAVAAGGNLVYRVDALGSPVWGKRVSSTAGSVDLVRIAPTRDGGVLLGGGVGSDGLVFKLDATGAVLWSRQYAGRLGEVVERPDGSIVLLASWSVDASGFLLKLAPDGSLVEGRQFFRPVGWGTPFFSVISTSDGGLAAAGRWGDGSPADDGIVLKTASGLDLDGACSLYSSGAIAESPVMLSLTDAALSPVPTVVAAVPFALGVGSPSVQRALVCPDMCAVAPSVVSGLLGSKNGADAAWSWTADAGAAAYNVWYVPEKVDIDLARASSAPPATPVIGCAIPSPAGGTTCTDTGAISRSSPATFFYQVRAYCDAATEGP